MSATRNHASMPTNGGGGLVGDNPLVLFLTMLPMLIVIGLAVLLIVLGVRLVRAVERIADKLS
jgi:hypothetical protein